MLYFQPTGQMWPFEPYHVAHGLGNLAVEEAAAINTATLPHFQIPKFHVVGGSQAMPPFFHTARLVLGHDPFYPQHQVMPPPHEQLYWGWVMPPSHTTGSGPSCSPSDFAWPDRVAPWVLNQEYQSDLACRQTRHCPSS